MKKKSAVLLHSRAIRAGVVLVDCPGCHVRHLIADRKGWFGQTGSVEDFLAQKGEETKRLTGEDALELTAEELAGWSAGARGG